MHVWACALWGTLVLPVKGPLHRVAHPRQLNRTADVPSTRADKCSVRPHPSQVWVCLWSCLFSCGKQLPQLALGT